jgi:hypothetical protein
LRTMQSTLCSSNRCREHDIIIGLVVFINVDLETKRILQDVLFRG